MQLVAIKRAAASLIVNSAPFACLSFSPSLYCTLPLPFSTLSASIEQFRVEVALPYSSGCLSPPFATSRHLPFHSCSPSFYLPLSGSLFLPLPRTACLPQCFVAHKFHALHLRVSGTSNMQHMAAVLLRTQTKHS